MARTEILPLGDQLRVWREDRNLTLTGAAKIGGLQPTQLRKWESGEWVPTLMGFSDYVQKIGIPDDEIIQAVKSLRLP